ncbi:MAG: MFS transporter [Desulfovibrionaceae bacterium]|nr:MFS transporter [Desulfovibrionaceae bacterium]MBF0513569.1 MFS transporter [Desulfovibrionaceae bacterium]
MKSLFPSAPGFWAYWQSLVSSSAAYQMLTVAIGWQVYAVSGSVMNLGLVGLAQFAPQLLLTLIVGDAADRFDRRRIAMVCQALMCAGAAWLSLVSFLGWPSLTAVFSCAVLFGAARAFEMPVVQAMLPGLVEAPDLPRSLSLSASARQAAMIAGPALGGALYLPGAFVAYGACALLFALALLRMVKTPTVKLVAKREPFSIKTLFGGIAYAKSQPVILGALSLDLFAVLLGGATALLPVYARDILHTGPAGLGVLRAAPSVGALLMSLVLARYPLKNRVGRKMFASVAVFGAGTVVFGLSESFALSLAALFTLGASDMISVVIRHTLVQIDTPDAMRGRLSAVNAVFIGTSNQLGEFESGLTAAWFGTVPAVVLGGVGTLVVVALWMRLFPSLRGRDQLVAAGPATTQSE